MHQDRKTPYAKHEGWVEAPSQLLLTLGSLLNTQNIRPLDEKTPTFIPDHTPTLILDHLQGTFPNCRYYPKSVEINMHVEYVPKVYDSRIEMAPRQNRPEVILSILSISLRFYLNQSLGCWMVDYNMFCSCCRPCQVRLHLLHLRQRA